MELLLGEVVEIDRMMGAEMVSLHWPLYIVARSLNGLSQSQALCCQMLVAPPAKANPKKTGADGVDVLTRPPDFKIEGPKYNTVRGNTHANDKSPTSTVFVVYENGRAYPHYLVRYYIGERDPKRTAYATKADVPSSLAAPAADASARAEVVVEITNPVDAGHVARE